MQLSNKLVTVVSLSLGAGGGRHLLWQEFRVPQVLGRNIRVSSFLPIWLVVGYGALASRQVLQVVDILTLVLFTLGGGSFSTEWLLKFGTCFPHMGSWLEETSGASPEGKFYHWKGRVTTNVWLEGCFMLLLLTDTAFFEGREEGMPGQLGRVRLLLGPGFPMNRTSCLSLGTHNIGAFY